MVLVLMMPVVAALLTIGLVSGVAAWPGCLRWVRRHGWRATRRRVDRSSAALVAAIAGHGRRGEARLTRWLLDGQVSTGQYRQAMADLAADQARRDPVQLPPDW
ncbi:MAG TPA: hypothetical protein VJT31_19630 [Rugosimonospora sp.]|nr:hypothetical protein [Rugosimonospora sp.]